MKRCVVIIDAQTITGYVVAREQIPGSDEKRYIVSKENGELISVPKELVMFD